MSDTAGLLHELMAGDALAGAGYVTSEVQPDTNVNTSVVPVITLIDRDPQTGAETRRTIPRPGYSKQAQSTGRTFADTSRSAAAPMPAPAVFAPVREHLVVWRVPMTTGTGTVVYSEIPAVFSDIVVARGAHSILVLFFPAEAKPAPWYPAPGLPATLHTDALVDAPFAVVGLELSYEHNGMRVVHALIQ